MNDVTESIERLKLLWGKRGQQLLSNITDENLERLGVLCNAVTLDQVADAFEVSQTIDDLLLYLAVAATALPEGASDKPN